MILALACGIGVFLAYANGANDNFKGVATLYGSGTTSYAGSIRWATVMQILGSVTALVLAQGLLETFSGKGLVPDAVVASRSFALSVGLAAGATVILATRFGFPISTTHALTGALVGAGLLASASGVNLARLVTVFLAPLLISPILAVLAGSIGYLAFRRARDASAIEKELCICIGTEVVSVAPAGLSPQEALSAFRLEMPSVRMEPAAQCVERYRGKMLGIPAQVVLDGLHYVSAGAVCFARALNDTPKIAATLLVGHAIMPGQALAAAGMAMAAGGWLQSRRIAETMSHGMTHMNRGQGFSANLVTSLLVVFASKLGLPVSTTHVSCGAIFGIGAVTRQAKWKAILGVLLAWITTLPVAALLGAGFFLVMNSIL